MVKKKKKCEVKGGGGGGLEGGKGVVQSVTNPNGGAMPPTHPQGSWGR